MDNPEIQDIVMPAAGVHIMLPAHFSPARMGLIVPKTTDGRYLYVQEMRLYGFFSCLLVIIIIIIIISIIIIIISRVPSFSMMIFIEL